MIDPWLRICDRIREKIESGDLLAETPLEQDSVAPQASEADYLRATEHLALEGLLHRTSDGRFTVAETRARSQRSASFHSDYSNQNREPTREKLDLRILPSAEAPEFVRTHLSQSLMLVRHHHVQIVDGTPHAIADSYVPYELIGQRYQDLEKADIFDLLRESGYPVTRKQETIRVRAAKPFERKCLDIEDKPSVRIIRLDCIVWSKETVVEVCLLYDRADLYQLQYTYDV